MDNKELYDKVISAYNSNDEHLMVAAARNWVAGAENAPFKEIEARELFSAAKRHYEIWQSGAISCRISKQRMVACVKKIAAMGLDNPYVEKAAVETKEPEVKEHEVKYIFGVVPVETDTAEKNEPAEHKKIFGKKNKKR